MTTNLADTDRLDSFLAQFVRGRVGLFLDIDGTLAPIADRPEDARVPTWVLSLLRELREHCYPLAIVSGRTVAAGRRLVPVDGAVYIGNHGLERYPDGRPVPKPSPFIQETAATAVEMVDDQGIELEFKGPAISIHYRRTADPHEIRTQLIKVLSPGMKAQKYKLLEGRAVIEIRPLSDSSKGAAITGLLNEYKPDTAIFFGDDITDISGFHAVQRWRSLGHQGIAVAVRSNESARAVLEAADTTVKSTNEVGSFLARAVMTVRNARVPSAKPARPGG